MDRSRTESTVSGIHIYHAKNSERSFIVNNRCFIYTLVRRRGLKTSSNDRANDTRASWKRTMAAIGARIPQAACGLNNTPRRSAALIITPQLELEYGTMPKKTRPV